MGRSSKIRHRRRRREGLALVQCVRAMQRALAESLEAFARARKDRHVIPDPCEHLRPSSGRERSDQPSAFRYQPGSGSESGADG